MKNNNIIYKCFVLFNFENETGIGPDMWFWSICIRFKLGRFPISSGMEPVRLFPFTSLHACTSLQISINSSVYSWLIMKKK